MFDVTYEQISNGIKLHDGDVTKVVVEDGYFDNETIGLGLQLSKSLNKENPWWKAIYLSNSLLVERQDTTVLMIAMVSYQQFLDSQLILWKSKSLGNHESMYKVVDAHDHMKGGKIYNLVWLHD